MGGVPMNQKTTNQFSFLILLIVTFLVSVIYILIALNQNTDNDKAPGRSVFQIPSRNAVMQSIRENREEYTVESVPLDTTLTFTLNITPDSPDIGKVLYEDDHGSILVSDITTDDDRWRIYFDFIGKGDIRTFSLLSLDIDNNNTFADEADSQNGDTAESKDWQLKISYDLEGINHFHKDYLASHDLLPMGERIGYYIFFSANEQEAAESLGGLDVSFTMKGLSFLTWTELPSAT